MVLELLLLTVLVLLDVKVVELLEDLLDVLLLVDVELLLEDTDVLEVTLSLVVDVALLLVVSAHTTQSKTSLDVQAAELVLEVALVDVSVCMAISYMINDAVMDYTV